MKTTPGTAEGKQTRRKPYGHRSIKEEFHIRNCVVEVDRRHKKGKQDGDHKERPNKRGAKNKKVID